MYHKFRKISLSLLVLILPWPALAMTGDREQPIRIEADRVDIDDKKGASVYQGNVRMTQGSIVLTADTVTVYTVIEKQVVNGKETKRRELQKIVAEGKQANYRQLLDSLSTKTGKNEELKARADRIDYFAAEERVVLQGGGYLWKEGDEFTGNVIEYDARDETVKAAKAQTGPERVQAVIQPRRKDNESKAP
ncbi:MAG: lipopolysaccharide transport periplasmic protein LptA [Gammaproteobacteria bacterium]|nr:lipopolysaccharide transport periplasmic protein LptA [Gammaproteobacteria bacterium]